MTSQSAQLLLEELDDWQAMIPLNMQKQDHPLSQSFNLFPLIFIRRTKGKVFSHSSIRLYLKTRL